MPVVSMSVVLCALFLSPADRITSADPPRNVILFIGDGMGFEQVRAAGMYANGTPGSLSFETLPYRGELTTYSANSSVTDSAAAATALATGVKVNNGVLSMAIPGDGGELFTLQEYFSDRGLATGLVTTTYMTHATPAAFGAHEPSRYNNAEIAADYLDQTRPEVLFGGGAHGMSGPSATAAGYAVVNSRAEMQALDTDTAAPVSGQFSLVHMPYEYDGLGDMPHLSEMTATALDILDNDPDGLFLMVEGGRIDHAGHNNDIQRNIFETLEFANAVDQALAWAEGRSDTLILVTADHETGGLAVLQNNGPGVFPTVSWSTTGHTGVNVPIYGWGVNADMIFDDKENTAVLDNTEVFSIATVPEPTTAAMLALGLAILVGRKRRDGSQSQSETRP